MALRKKSNWSFFQDWELCVVVQDLLETSQVNYDSATIIYLALAERDQQPILL